MQCGTIYKKGNHAKAKEAETDSSKTHSKPSVF